jgi:hypothetical protein
MSKKFLQTSAMALGLALAFTSSAKASLEINVPANAYKAVIEWWQGEHGQKLTLKDGSVETATITIPSDHHGYWNEQWVTFPNSSLQVTFYGKDTKVVIVDTSFTFNEWNNVPSNSTVGDVLNNTSVDASNPENVTMAYTPPVNQ